MKRIITIIALAAIAAVSMGSKCGIRPPPMPQEPKDTHMCAAACAHLQMLGCPEGEPLRDGTTCEKFCIDTQKKGHALRPSCLVTINKCSEVDAKCHKKPREVFE